MKRFRFQLDPLLRVRSATEDEARRALAGLLRQQRDIEDHIRRQQEHLAEGRDAIRSAVSGRVDLLTMRYAAQASMQVMREANRLVLQLAGLQRKIGRARAELLERSRERRALELLRERRRADWRRACGREAQNLLDDLAQHPRKEIGR